MPLRTLIARLVSAEPKPLVVNIQEASRLMKVCPRTVKNLIQSGELRSRKVRGRRLIPVAALDKLVR